MAADGERAVQQAVQLAARLQERAAVREPRAARSRRRRLGRLLADPRGRALLLDLTDRVLRVRRPARAARQLARLDLSGAVSWSGAVDSVLLHAGAAAAPWLPRLTMPLVSARVRAETAAVVLPAGHADYAQHARRRAAQGIRLNVNVLGEAILGEAEARRRLDAVLERMSWPEVTAVSVKATSLCAQLDVLAYDDGVARVSERLGELYAAAARRDPPTLVTVDMEEYRDLHLTADAVMRALDEPAARHFDAGIVLQAYLPDSVGVLQELAGWAAARRAAGGGRTRVRLVKGANLAMERVDADLHGWEQAPFATKAEVDANYKRLLELALDPRLSDCLQVGVASHNVFDLAWALVCRSDSGAEARVEPEMLEGMAEGLALETAELAGSLLLYAPVAEAGDLLSATAYLARRLDENASPDNFLNHQFSLTTASEQWTVERDRFVASVRDRHSVRAEPRRRQDRLTELVSFDAEAPFTNEPDTDFSLARNRSWVEQSLRDHASAGAADEPAVSVSVSVTVTDVDLAVARARAALLEWSQTTTEHRRRVLTSVAEVMARRRGRSIAVMAAEGGKTVGESDPEVSEGIDFARYYAASTRELDRMASAGTRFVPLGVVVVASPWNFPYAIPAGGVLAALAAGNTVVLKPAPETVRTARVLVEQCWAGGVPPEVLQLVPCGDDDAGRRLVTSPDVAAVVLTGSWDTAQLFLGWKPQLRLHAETSGKNAMVITETADLDGAIKDLVRSAFGHAGQKCSAASLAIVEAAVYDDPAFHERLRDAVTTLRVGPASDPATVVGPLVAPPRGPLADALRTLQPGERWLVEPRELGPTTWTPGVKTGVAPGSSFHLTECFGPVLGVMRATDLAHAVELQNAPAYGLTGGIWSLDDSEVDYWLEHVEVGNAYVNRHTTGAVVQRQPFGGWKRSSVGRGVKAGGPGYVLSLGRCLDGPDVADDYAEAWRQLGADSDPSGLEAESNVLRHRPLPRGVLLRVDAATASRDVSLALAAAGLAGTRVLLSDASVEDAAVAAWRAGAVDRVRVLGGDSDPLRRACHAAGTSVDDDPVSAYGRAELRHWVREQSISRTLHRYGNVAGVRPPVSTRPSATSRTRASWTASRAVQRGA
ncbi:RHH-type proline utilization regulon transcriptional repressor/proline dehydrogenase/delta 1-pyrroline-5-carboxylate dehydrogenase [Motilibacter peucedani]|uniref:L-glutamate gamma-semialdehyde dehydrogenase n=1 Tax=Motilibacter peucedani TaxID=598650 RepID=A0A420XKT2_9ACTN|nr:proline dehydrogenase family protein [Motilibacter peucedani]RKS68047.1 RHH-type proline utilization regulon transcriptional repressor/proline dehydrogenase/delta 1-pyrroline-5-carboxylate dehydrogenase [Motilibacter peucedani]